MNSIVKIEEIVNILSGFAWNSSRFKDSGEIPIVRIQNLGDNPNAIFVYWHDDYNQKYIIKKGDLLLSLSGSIKIDVWDGEKALLNQRIIKMVPKKKIDKRWLYWQINSSINKITNMGNWALVNNVSVKDIAKLKINLLEETEQKQIAQILDGANNLRQKRKEQLALLDNYLKSVFLEMFGDPIVNQKKWKRHNLGKFTSYVGSGATPLGGSKVYLDSGIIFIRSQNVLMNKLEFSNVAYISKKIHSTMKRTYVKRDDVLLNITGASIGRVAIFNGEDNSANVNQHVCIIRLNDYRLNPIFLCRFIAQPSFQMKILSSNSGATRQAYNFSQIKKFDIFLPPIELQTKFASIVEQVENTKQKMRDSLKEMDNHFNALMQRYFV